MNANKRVGLADVARRLRATYGHSPTHRYLYTGVVDGTLPATKSQGRWYVEEDDLAKIAAITGLVPEPQASDEASATIISA